MSDARRYPLVFLLRELVLGNGFVAAVEAQVRAIAENHEGDWWIMGVNPGAIAEHGPSLHEAVTSFRQRLTTVLIDAAAVNTEFDGFANELREFFTASDLESVTQWTEARAAVRRGEIDLPGVQRSVDEWEPRVSVSKVDLTPRGNFPPPPASSIAA